MYAFPPLFFKCTTTPRVNIIYKSFVEAEGRDKRAAKDLAAYLALEQMK